MPGLLSALGGVWSAWKDAGKIKRWRAAGSPVPPPAAAKRSILLEFAKRSGVRVFVETGTHKGATAAALATVCPRVYTIEIEPAKVAAARARFAAQPGVTVLEGDSGLRLPEVLAELHEPALFWLDGHYMPDGRSGRADDQTPISAEMAAVLDHPVRAHVILIDDARLFDGQHGYPRLDDLRRHVATRRPDLAWAVADDIIRVTPVR